MQLFLYIIVLFFVFIILFYQCELRGWKKSSDYFREEYIKTYKESVEHFSNEIMLRSLLNDAFILINTEYTFRRNSKIWKQFKGVETRDRIKDFLNDNKSKNDKLKGFPVEIISLQSVKDINLGLAIAKDKGKYFWKNHETQLERIKVIRGKLLKILADNIQENTKLKD